MLTRRVLLGVGLTSAGVLAAGCADDGEETAVGVERRTYGGDPSQWADLHRPEGGSRGVVVVIHGGFWKAAYDASLGTPLAEDLAARGWTAWNVEYRRVGENGGGDGGGGGVPATLDDVADAIDALADVPGLDLSTVVTLGHSAGGHLATWAAGRERYPRWAGAAAGAGAVPVTAVVSQAGVLDLVAAADAGLGAGAVEAFVGGAPSAYDLADPMRQVPLAVPVWCVHGTSDTEVPLSQSADYVAAARAAGATAELVEVEGDHYVVIDPTSDAWTRTLTILDGLG